MATLTYNASFTGSARNASVTAGAGGALTGKVALLVDNTINAQDAERLIFGLLHRWSRDKSKAVKPGDIATSGTTTE